MEAEIVRKRALLQKSLSENDRWAIEDKAFFRAIRNAGGIEAAAEKFSNDPAEVIASGLTHQEQRLLEGKTLLSEALKRDQRLYPVKTIKHQVYGFREFLNLHGDVPIDEISRDQVMAFVAQCRANGLAEPTIKRRLGSMGAVLNRYFADHDISRRNPLSRVPLKHAGPTKADREPLTDEQVRQLDAFLSSADGHKPRNRALLWLVRSSTLGPSEAGGLLPQDIVLDHEVPHIIVRANEIRTLKAKSRHRLFPLVGGALDWAEHLPAKTFNPNSTSAQLNKMLRTAIPNLGPKQSAYSLRHWMRDRLYKVGASHDEARYLMGHSAGSSHDRYGSSSPDLLRLRDILEHAVTL